MKIYIICPVRNQTENQGFVLGDYVKKLENQGNSVFYPMRDAPQESKTGYEIVMSEFNAMWDVNSKGSHFDLGMCLAMGKIIKIIHQFQEDVDGKSYIKVIKEYSKYNGYTT